MPGKIRGKERDPKELRYGNLVPLDFTDLTLPASNANTVVQAAIPLACAFKIAAVGITSQTAVNNAATFNIVLDGNAEGSVGTADNYDTTGAVTLAAAGTKVFSADTAIPTSANGTSVVLPAVGEVIYPAGHALTLRVVTGGSQTGKISVQVYGRFVDINPTNPQADTTAGGAPHTYQFGVDPL